MPLLVLLAQFLWVGHGRGRTVYIEEPEAHLFPSAQKLIIELMAEVFRAWSGGMCFIVFSRNPMTGTDVQKYKVQFRQSFNSCFSLEKDKVAVRL